MKRIVLTGIFSTILFIGSYSALAGDIEFSRDLFPKAMKFAGVMSGKKDTAVYKVDLVNENGRDVIHAVWDSPMRYTETVMGLNALSSIRSKIKNMDKGTEVDIEYNSSGALFRYKDKKGIKEKKINRNGLHDCSSLDVALLGYPFPKAPVIDFSAIDACSGPGASVSEIKVKLDGTEIINVNGRKIDCYRLKAVPSGLMGIFVSFNYWYTVSSPHEYVKFSGPGYSYERIFE